MVCNIVWTGSEYGYVQLHCFDLNLWLADFKICLKVLSGWPQFVWLHCKNTLSIWQLYFQCGKFRYICLYYEQWFSCSEEDNFSKCTFYFCCCFNRNELYAKRKERFEEETKKQLVGNIVLTRLAKDVYGVHFVSVWYCNALWLFMAAFKSDSCTLQ